MSLIHLTKEERKLIKEGINSLMNDYMRTLNQTHTSSFMFADPEEAREKIYDTMDKLEDLLERFELYE